jgi:hypothetical protein
MSQNRPRRRRQAADRLQREDAEVETLTARIDEIEQKGVRGGGQDEPEVDRRDVRRERRRQGLARFEPEQGQGRHARHGELNSATTNADGSVGDAINQTRLPGILPLASAG